MSWMETIVCKLTLPCGLVVDCCARKISVAKKCMLLPHHTRIFGCDLNSECITLSLPQLVLVPARQVSNKE